MKIVWALLLLLVLYEVANAKRSHKKRPKKHHKKKAPVVAVEVSTMCANKNCGHDKVCRVVKSCLKNRRNRLLARCVHCVPEDVDDVCNSNSYYRVVLLSGSKKNRFSQHGCQLNAVANTASCPTGSVCVANPKLPGYGVCCYGKPASATLGPVNNIDPQCGKCGKPCGFGFTCQGGVSRCGRMVYKCKAAVTTP